MFFLTDLSLVAQVGQQTWILSQTPPAPIAHLDLTVERYTLALIFKFLIAPRLQPAAHHVP